MYSNRNQSKKRELNQESITDQEIGCDTSYLSSDPLSDSSSLCENDNSIDTRSTIRSGLESCDFGLESSSIASNGTSSGESLSETQAKLSERIGCEQDSLSSNALETSVETDSTDDGGASSVCGFGQIDADSEKDNEDIQTHTGNDEQTEIDDAIQDGDEETDGNEDETTTGGSDDSFDEYGIEDFLASQAAIGRHTQLGIRSKSDERFNRELDASLDALEQRASSMVRDEMQQLRKRLDELETRCESFDMKMQIVTSIIRRAKLGKPLSHPRILSTESLLTTDDAEAENSEDDENSDYATTISPSAFSDTPITEKFAQMITTIDDGLQSTTDTTTIEPVNPCNKLKSKAKAKANFYNSALKDDEADTSLSLSISAAGSALTSLSSVSSSMTSLLYKSAQQSLDPIQPVGDSDKPIHEKSLPFTYLIGSRKDRQLSSPIETQSTGTASSCSSTSYMSSISSTSPRL